MDSDLNSSKTRALNKIGEKKLIYHKRCYSPKYINDIKPCLCCSICGQVMQSPKLCPKGHSFCSGCIDNVITTKKNCPKCNQIHFVKNVKNLTENLYLKDVIDEIRIPCPTIPDEGSDSTKCDWIGKISSVKDHFNICQFYPVLCTNQECSEIIRRKDALIHSMTCEHRTVLCEWCNFTFSSNKYDLHKAICTLSTLPIPCPNGCYTKGQITITCNADLINHNEGCTEFIIPCQFAKFGCKMCFPRKDQTSHCINHMNEHYAMLLKRIKELETQVEKGKMKDCVASGGDSNNGRNIVDTTRYSAAGFRPLQRSNNEEAAADDNDVDNDDDDDESSANTFYCGSDGSTGSLHAVKSLKSIPITLEKQRTTRSLATKAISSKCTPHHPLGKRSTPTASSSSLSTSTTLDKTSQPNVLDDGLNNRVIRQRPARSPGTQAHILIHPDTDSAGRNKSKRPLVSTPKPVPANKRQKRQTVSVQSVKPFRVNEDCDMWRNLLEEGHDAGGGDNTYHPSALDRSDECSSPFTCVPQVNILLHDNDNILHLLDDIDSDFFMEYRKNDTSTSTSTTQEDHAHVSVSSSSSPFLPQQYDPNQQESSIAATSLDAYTNRIISSPMPNCESEMVTPNTHSPSASLPPSASAAADHILQLFISTQNANKTAWKELYSISQSSVVAENTRKIAKSYLIPIYYDVWVEEVGEDRKLCKELSKELFPWLENQSNKFNDKHAHFILGFINKKNLLLKWKDAHKRGYQYFLKAENCGHLLAEFWLGGYASGNFGCTKDTSKNVEKNYYRISAEKGYSLGQIEYAEVLKDEGKVEEAFVWYEKAANQGNVYAVCNLALLYYDIGGCVVDLNKAKQLYKLASSSGLVEADYHLGVLYDKNGDEENAIFHMERAAKAKVFDATACLKKMKTLLGST